MLFGEKNYALLPKFLQKPPPTFYTVHLFHRLYCLEPVSLWTCCYVSSLRVSILLCSVLFVTTCVHFVVTYHSLDNQLTFLGKWC